ncbi:intraflagellar transport protein 57 [Klebsormidium nitens]|uniref:Intraflagellar transport protein 57 n=1 Tax=Klebsormidium nitens TaxID=105231 RepID=A0A1Y1HVJ0_KLENI|nr:intraflagellar transport protein 57 [Klebsormidium nitens]|eukprot:GAQ80546.1 intraflagellar transport protein 57 [Klebsormidium nitens]
MASHARRSMSRSRQYSDSGGDLDGDATMGPETGAPGRAAPSGRSVEPEAPADVLVEFIVEKLKLLNYEKEFCKRRRPPWPPLARTYFAYPSNNANEQLFYFTSLVTFLLSLSGRRFKEPGQFDDPNATCTNILMELQNLGFAPPSFPPAKLKQGYGDAVCGVLDGLASLALEKQKFVFRAPVYKSESYPEEAEADEEGDEDDILDEAMMPDLDDDDDALVGVTSRDTGAGPSIALQAPLESKVDPAEWKLELERVGPQLRLTVVADVKDWRTHLEQASQQHGEIAKSLPEGKGQLDKVESEVAAALEKLSTREKYINSQFVELTQDYRTKRDVLSEKQEAYNKSMDSIAKLTDELAHISERLESIKQTMDERGNDISDSSPLVKIKKAIEALKSELKQMEVRIGVAEHTLLQVNLKRRDKGALNGAYNKEELY